MESITKTRVALLIIMLALLFFIGRHVWEPVCRGGYYIYSASLYGMIRFGAILYGPMDRWLQERATMQELIDEIGYLTKEKNRLQAEIITMKGSYAFQEDIRELSQFLQRYQSKKGLCAHILSRTLTSYGHFCYLNVGLQDGIQEDMIMITNQGIIGRIVTVYPWFCKGIFITDASSKITCYTTKTKVKGVCEGKNDFYCSLQVVNGVGLPDNHELVMSSGHGFVFPQGFCLGEIVESHMTDVSSRSIVKPLVDLKTIEYCVVVSRADIEAHSEEI